MTPQSMQHICQIVMLVSAILGALGLYGNFYYGNQIQEKIMESDNSIKIEEMNVTGNKGHTQVNIGSPGSKQAINDKRVIKQEVLREKGIKNGAYFLRLTFKQTEGIWDMGTKFWMQLQLTGPYTRYSFVSGYPPTLPLVNVRTTAGSKEAANKGWIELETSTPPLKEPIVLEIEASTNVDIKKILLEPTDGYRTNNN